MREDYAGNIVAVERKYEADQLRGKVNKRATPLLLASVLYSVRRISMELEFSWQGIVKRVAGPSHARESRDSCVALHI